MTWYNKKKNPYAEVAKTDGKNESYICYVVKNQKKKKNSSFAVAPQIVKVTSTVHGKMEKKTFNFWDEDMNRKHVPIDGNVLQQSP